MGSAALVIAIVALVSSITAVVLASVALARKR